MSTRDKFIVRIKSQLAEWETELHELEARLGDAREDVRDKYQHAIEELRDKKLGAELKLEELKHAGEEAWDDLKDEVERTWTALKAGLDAMRDFSDHS